MKRKGSLSHITISSAKRERCVPQIGAGRQEFEREVAVGDGVERIGRGPVEAQSLGGLVAVDREGRAGQRAGAQAAIR